MTHLSDQLSWLYLCLIVLRSVHTTPQLSYKVTRNNVDWVKLVKLVKFQYPRPHWLQFFFYSFSVTAVGWDWSGLVLTLANYP